jgi:hypothetical protein
MKYLTHVLCLSLLGCGGMDASSPTPPESENRAATMAEAMCTEHGGLLSTQGDADETGQVASPLSFACIDGSVGEVQAAQRVQ